MPTGIEIIDYGGMTAEALRAPGPLPALIALLLAAGIAEWGWWIGGWLRIRPAALRWAAGFSLACAGLTALLHAWAWAGGLSVGGLRGFALPLALAGLCGSVRVSRGFVQACRTALQGWRCAPALERAAAVLAGVVALALLAAALGPAVDYDSNVYHLAIPLDWLSSGGMLPRVEWCQARMAGAGETLNMLGLAAGSDCLGAALQWSAGAGCAWLFAERAGDGCGRALGLLWIAACPAMVVLAPNQKPYLLPLLAILVAAALLLEPAAGGTETAVAGALAGFALACKVSFLPEAALLAVLAASRIGRSRERLAGFAGAAAAFGLLAGPLLVRRWLQFGDPFSPVLERLRASPDPGITGCVAMVTDFHSRGAVQLALLPLRAVVLLPGGDPTYVIGIAFLGTAVLIVRWRTHPALVAICSASLCAAAAFGPFSPRFFLPAYLWSGLAVVALPASRARTWWLRALLLQCAAVAALSAWTAVRRAPGIAGGTVRARVEGALTRGLDEARWLAEVVPRGRVLLSPHTSYYRLTVPFRPAARILYAPAEPDGRRALAGALRESPAVWIAQEPAAPGDLFARAAARCGRPLARHPARVARIFRAAEPPVMLTLYELDERRPGCLPWLDAPGGDAR